MNSRLYDYVADALRNPSERLSRWQQTARQSWELAVYCWRQLQHHRAEGMAAELTYRTVFSLIPVVVLGLVMFRIFGGLEEVQNKVEYQLYSFFGVPEVIPAAYLSPEERREADDVSVGPVEESGLIESVNPEEAAEGDAQQKESPQKESPQKESEPIESASGLQVGAADSPGETTDGASAADAQPRADYESAESGPGATGQLDSVESVGGDRRPGQASEPSRDSDAQKALDLSEAARQDAALEETRREARASIRRKLHEVTSMVSSIDFRSIGVFGLLLFVYAAVALASSTEHLFNRIYDAPAQRPVHLRLAIHWSIITLGSGLLAMSLYMSGQLIEWSGTVGADSNTRLLLTHILSVAASWVLLFLLYALMPNTHVSLRAAVTGALVGALLWEAAKFGFQIYVVKAVPYSNIYGSIGLIPLFLFWIYVTWWIVLFGLILTYTLQTFGGRLPTKLRDRDGVLLSGDPDWMLPIMCEVGRAFSDGQTINQQDLADQVGLSSRQVHEMTEQLIAANLLRRLAGEEDSLTLARPAERIRISDILNLAHHVRPTNDHPAWRALASLKQAERDAAGDKTLADLVVL